MNLNVGYYALVEGNSQVYRENVYESALVQALINELLYCLASVCVCDKLCYTVAF